jgi:hemolysin activation/secretion protein
MWSALRAAVARFAVLAGMACCEVARAQAAVPTPPVVPRASDLAPRTPAASAAEAPPPPAPPRELGKPEEDVRIDVVRYEVPADAPAELRAALPKLTEPYTGKDRGFEDLVNAAAEVTRYLQRDLGYYLGYAYLPEQEPKDGVVRIAVLEGRLDKIVLEWKDGLPVDRDVVEAYLARLQPGTILHVRDVERVVFLVNDLRGITTTFEVRAGSTPGTASLVVKPRAESVWSGKADIDVNGSRFLGVTRLSGLGQWNSPFGRGDGITGNVLVSTGLRFALVGYNTPIGGDGLKLGTSLSLVRYQLDRNTFDLDLNGSAATANGYGLYPVIRSRNVNLFSLASLEYKTYDDRQSVTNTGTKKNARTLTLGTTGDFRDSLLGGGVNTFDFSLVAGRLGLNNGNGEPEEKSRFGKATFSFTRLQDLATGRLLGYAALRGQWARENLDTTEQFRVGGPEGVRGFAPGEGTGDLGAILSLELRWLPPEDWFGRIARETVANVFYDVARVRYRADPLPNSTDINADTFSAAGFGLTWVRPGEYALRASLAKPISGTPRNDPRVRDPRLYLQASVFFN